MKGRMPWWAWAWPLLAWGVLLATSAAALGGTLVVAADSVVLVAAVFAAVWHAEVVAHRVGEPFGTLVLALAVTVIEVALIVSVMLAGKAGSEALARDTAFAVVMLILNGLVGLSLLIGGVTHHEQEFQVRGASAALAVLAALVTLSLVLPNFTTAVAGPAFSPSQLVFAGTASLVLYGVFIFVQAVRHRDYFLPDQKNGVAMGEETHAQPPSTAAALTSLVLLLLSLVVVVGLAKALTPAVDEGIAALGAPKAVVGIIIAAVVLMPEGMAALRAAHHPGGSHPFRCGERSAARDHGLDVDYRAAHGGGNGRSGEVPGSAQMRDLADLRLRGAGGLAVARGAARVQPETGARLRPGRFEGRGLRRHRGRRASGRSRGGGRRERDGDHLHHGASLLHHS